MPEKLPISIQVCDELAQQFIKIISISNKLEAQFNFQTMTANWYSDEDSIWFVRLYIETPQTFLTQKKRQAHQAVHTYSDDAFGYFDAEVKEQVLICYIAITDTELTMLNQQTKLVEGLLHVKLQKLLQLIANDLKLNSF